MSGTTIQPHLPLFITHRQRLTAIGPRHHVGTVSISSTVALSTTITAIITTAIEV